MEQSSGTFGLFGRVVGQLESENSASQVDKRLLDHNQLESRYVFLVSIRIFFCLGKYEYKYLVDGKWALDNNATKSDSNSGNVNNLIHIDEADFEVFCALDKDLAASNAGAAMLKMK